MKRQFDRFLFEIELLVEDVQFFVTSSKLAYDKTAHLLVMEKTNVLIGKIRSNEEITDEEKNILLNLIENIFEVAVADDK